MKNLILAVCFLALGLLVDAQQLQLHPFGEKEMFDANTKIFRQYSDVDGVIANGEWSGVIRINVDTHESMDRVEESFISVIFYRVKRKDQEAKAKLVSWVLKKGKVSDENTKELSGNDARDFLSKIDYTEFFSLSGEQPNRSIDQNYGNITVAGEERNGETRINIRRALSKSLPASKLVETLREYSKQ